MKKSNIMALLLSFGYALLPISAQAASVLHRDLNAEPASIDPQRAAELSGGAVLIDTFEGLTSSDSQGNAIPGVAESWEISEDGKTWIFHLRDTNWSDGTPLTADDFVYSWQRDVDPATASPSAFMLFPVKNAQAIATGDEKDLTQLGVTALDAHTLQVELESPTPYFAQLTSHFSTFPAPKHIIEQYGDKWTQPEYIVSNGAFHLSEWTPQSQIVLNKSDTYWDRDNVDLDQVIYHNIEDLNSALSRYRAGELDMSTVPLEQLSWVKENLGDQLHFLDFLGTYYYGFNLTKEPFKDQPELRRALSMAIDRNVITEKILQGNQKPAYSIVPPNTPNYQLYKPEWADWPRDKQIAEAKRLYEAAGYSKDNPLRFELLYNTSEDHKKIAIAISSMWKQILGVETELVNQEWKVMITNLTQKNTQMFRSGWGGNYSDAKNFLAVFRSDSSSNHTGYNNPKFEQILDNSDIESDPEQRAVLLHDAAQEFGEDDAIIPIYHYTRILLVKPNISGVYATPLSLIPSQHIKKRAN